MYLPTLPYQHTFYHDYVEPMAISHHRTNHDSSMGLQLPATTTELAWYKCVVPLARAVCTVGIEIRHPLEDAFSASSP